MQWSSDPKKYAINLKRHGVRFEDAALVFDDPFARIKDDSAHEPGRLQIIGRPYPERECSSSSTSRSTITLSGSSARATQRSMNGGNMKAAKKGAGSAAAKKRAGKPAIKYPSKASLREMPELPPDAELKPNKYAKKIHEAGGGWFHVEGQPPKWLPSPRGRPPKGEKAETTRTHSVRLPDSVWEKLKQLAEARGTGANTLAAEVLAEFAQRGAA